MIIKLLGKIALSLLGLFGEKGKQARDKTVAVLDNMQRSGTDEVITVIFFAPLVVAWFNADAAQAWFQVFKESPEWYKQTVLGITAAVYGLGKIGGYKK